MPQRHCQTVSEEGNQDVDIYPTLQLMLARLLRKLRAMRRSFPKRISC
jgi:hypothetical protein